MRIRTVRVPPEFKIEPRRIVLAESLTLTEWVRLLATRPDQVFPNNCFPTDEMRDDYLEHIETWEDLDVKRLLRNFLIHNGSYGADTDARRRLLEYADTVGLAEALNNEFRRRLFLGSAWEGLSWVLDLLPDHPKDALAVVDAYLRVHCAYFTDQQFDGALDALAVIRGRFMSSVHGTEALLSLTGVEFEHYIRELYRRLGYAADLTQMSHDGGIDVVADQVAVGRAHRVVIQCKQTTRKIGVRAVRELRGVLSRGDLPKAVFVTTSSFTSAARKFSADDPRLELVDGESLVRVLGECFGRHWPVTIDRIRIQRS